MQNRRDFRFATFALVLALAAFTFRVTMLAGLTSVVRVEGGSMAPTFLGDHVTPRCQNCGRHWAADANQWRATQVHFCPQCGEANEQPQSLEATLGTRVVIDRAAYLLAEPQRFDVVAVQVPGDPHTLAIKRVLGLPGEEVVIDRGDVLIAGERLQKSYAQFRATAMLAYQSTELASIENSWWQPGSSNSSWALDSSGFSWHGASDRPDRLEFQPKAIHPLAKQVASPVLDDDSYDPQLARPLNTMTDVVAVASVRGELPSLLLACHDGDEWIKIRFEQTSSDSDFLVAIAERNGRELARAVFGKPKSAWQIAWGMWDHQLGLALNDVEVIRIALPETEQANRAAVIPLALGATGDQRCDVSNFAVWRDIYYLNPDGLDRKHTFSTSDETHDYVLLGDNPPFSLDSRQWSTKIKGASIVGKVFKRNW